MKLHKTSELQPQHIRRKVPKYHENWTKMKENAKRGFLPLETLGRAGRLKFSKVVVHTEMQNQWLLIWNKKIYVHRLNQAGFPHNPISQHKTKEKAGLNVIVSRCTIISRVNLRMWYAKEATGWQIALQLPVLISWRYLKAKVHIK